MNVIKMCLGVCVCGCMHGWMNMFLRVCGGSLQTSTHPILIGICGSILSRGQGSLGQVCGVYLCVFARVCVCVCVKGSECECDVCVLVNRNSAVSHGHGFRGMLMSPQWGLC